MNPFARVRRDSAPAWLTRGWDLGTERRAEIGRARRRPTHLAGVNERVAATIRPKQQKRGKRR